MCTYKRKFLISAISFILGMAGSTDVFAGSVVVNNPSALTTSGGGGGGGGGGGSTFTLPASLALNNNNLNVMDYGAKCDGIQIQGASINSISTTTPTVTANNVIFTPADVGKSLSIFAQTGAQINQNQGTITGYVSPTSITISLYSADLLATSPIEMIYGTNDLAAFNAAIAAAESFNTTSNNKGSNKSVKIPPGICVLNGGITIGNGVNLYGSGNTEVNNSILYYTWGGTTLAFAGTAGGYAGITTKSTPSITKGQAGENIANLNIDTGPAATAITTQDYATNIRNVTVGHCGNVGIDLGNIALLQNSESWCTGYGTPVVANGGDIRIMNFEGGYSGATNSVINVTGSDFYITGSHLNPVNGAGGITANLYGNNSNIRIHDTIIDFSLTDAITINLGSTSSVSSIEITGNTLLYTGSYNTESFIGLHILAGGLLRNLNISNNTGYAGGGSFHSLINGYSSAGKILSSVVFGNNLDNVATALFTGGFVPTYNSANSGLIGSTTTLLTPQSGASFTAGASPYVYTAAFGQNVIINTVGGMTALTITRNGTAYSLSTSITGNMIHLDPTDTMTFTWTTNAPTFSELPD